MNTFNYLKKKGGETEIIEEKNPINHGETTLVNVRFLCGFIHSRGFLVEFTFFYLFY